MAHDVFISYAIDDKITAEAVCSALEARRVRCWIAPRDVQPGMDYAEAIVRAIGESHVLVLVFSGHSNQSPQVRREIEQAVNKGIAILPFRIEDVPPSPALDFFIRTAHWLDALTPPLRRHLQHLADTVESLLSRLEPPGPEVETPKATITVRAAAPRGWAGQVRRGLSRLFPRLRVRGRRYLLAILAVGALAGVVAGIVRYSPLDEGGSPAGPSDGLAVVARIPVGDGPSGVAALANHIYVSNQGDDNASVIDGATNTVTAIVPVAQGPSSVAVNPTTNRIYMANWWSASMSVIDGESNTLVATIALDSSPDAVAVNSTKNRVYVASGWRNSVSIIDADTNAIVLTVPVGNMPIGVAVNGTANRVYVGNSGDDSVSVIDGQTNTVVATIAVGTRPNGLAVNPLTNRIYVANLGSNTVSVINGESNTVMATKIGRAHV